MSSPLLGATRARYLSRLVRLTSLVVVAGLATTVPAAQAAVPPASAKPVPVTISKVTAKTAPTSTNIQVTAKIVVVNPSTTRRPADQLRVKLIGRGNLLNLGVVKVPAIRQGGRVTVSLTKVPSTVTPPGTYAVRACPIMRAAGPCRTSAATVRIGPASLVASPKSLAFGETQIGTTSTKRVTITNKGRSGSGRLTTSDLGRGAFDIEATTCSAALLPGRSCTVDVSYSPSSAGEDSRTLTVTPGRGNAVSVDLTGTGFGDAALSIDPTGNTFDDTQVGETSEPVDFNVTNDGDLATGVPAVTSTGPFDVTGTTCTAALAPAATCTVTVTFAPTGSGNSEGNVEVSATPGGIAAADLSGTGLAPASLSIDPTVNDFPATLVDDESDSQTITVTNDGDVPSGVPAVSLGTVDADQFDITANTCTAALDGGESCTVDVAFTPSQTGEVTASLDVTATPGGTVSADLIGTGETAPTLSISETSYDYGFTGDPAEHTFTITNDGTRTSGAPAVDVTGDAAFTVTSNTCTLSLPGGGTCTVGVTYTGSGTTEQTAQLSVSASPGDTVTADLTGSPLALTIEPASHDFGDVAVGSSSDSASFTLSNHRMTSVFVNSETTIGPFGVDSSCLTVAIPAQGTCTFTVHFSPMSGGSQTGYVEYQANGDTARTDLSGTGLAPAALSVDRPSIQFGAYAPATTTGTQVLTVTNTGDVATGSAPTVAIAGPDAAEFGVQDTTCSGPLAGGASCAFTLTFAPVTLADEKSATATVDGPGAPTSALAGVSAPLGVTMVPAVADFGTQSVGSSTIKVFRVVNTTEAGSGINSVSSQTPYSLDIPGDFTCVLSVSVIDAHNWCTISIAFRPTGPGTFPRTLSAGGDFGNADATMNGTAVGAPPRPGQAAAKPAGKPAYGVALRGGEPVILRD